MALLYILLIIIAIGVLLLSQEGKGILGILGWLAIIAGVLYVGFWIIVFILGFALTDTGKKLLGVGGFFLVISILAAIISKLSEKYNRQLKSNFIIQNKKKFVIGFWILWPLSFVLTYLAGNQLGNESMMLFFLTLSIGVFPIVGLLLLGFFGAAKSNTLNQQK